MKDNLVPKLRFKDDNEQDYPDWKERKLIEKVDRITNKNKDNKTDNILTISAKYGLIKQKEFFNKIIASKDLTGYYLLEKNDFAYNKSYSKGYPFGTIKKLKKYPIGIVSNLYICFKVKKNMNTVYLEHFFETSIWHKEISNISVEGARNHGLLNISINDFFNSKYNFPSLEEQEKIANFFTNIDKLIEKQNKKINKLESFKKGLIQKIFNQKLRFKNKNGENYPKWEEKRLKEIFIERKLIIEKDGSIPHVTLSKEGIYKKTKRYDREFLVRSNNKKYKVTFKDDICYNPANLKFGVICKNNFGQALFSPIYVTFEVLNQNVDFITYYICQNFFINKLLKYQEGTVYERSAVKPNDFLKLKINMPCIEEQENISIILSNVDKIISLEYKKLRCFIVLKKELMKKMFI